MKLGVLSTKDLVEGYVPRKDFGRKRKLKRSIKKNGVIDPILVRQVGDKYIIVDGIMRYRAAQELGLEEVPCIIIDADEENAYHLAYEKNVERQNFNPIEEANHIHEVCEKFDLNPEDLVRLGYAPHRATIDNKASLLTLPHSIQEYIAKDRVSQTQGYFLARLKDQALQLELAEEIVASGGMSVRKLKEAIQSRIDSRNLGDGAENGYETSALAHSMEADDYGRPATGQAFQDKVLLKACAAKEEKQAGVTPLLNSIILGDCGVVLKNFPDDCFDFICTDPNYGLGFMGLEWDKDLPSVATLRELLRVLKPGAFATFMSSPRADLMSRLINRLRLAGFWVDFTPLFWVRAQGFPKAHSISKRIDKNLGAEREIIGRNPNSREKCDKSNTIYESGTVGKTTYITKPATDEAKRFEGAYEGFEPKPTVEVIIVAMKPMSEKTYVEQALANGKGVAWMKDCRIPYADEVDKDSHDKKCSVNGVYATGLTWGGKRVLPKQWEPTSEKDGRFPANILVSDDVLNDGQEHVGGSFPAKRGKTDYFGLGEKSSERVGQIRDKGGFSRYFSLDAWAEKNLPFIIVPKPSKKDKGEGNDHPTCKPTTLMKYLITMFSREGDIVLDPFCGSASTCVAAKILKRQYIGIEIDQKYHKCALARMEGVAHLLRDERGRAAKTVKALVECNPKSDHVAESKEGDEKERALNPAQLPPAEPPKEKTSGTKEWASGSVNCCTGCSHDCRYCYAREMRVRLHGMNPEDWKNERIRQKDVDKSYRHRDGRIMFPTAHDITPGILDPCITVLENLLRAGNQVLIVSKPHLECIARICHEFGAFKENILFRFTITAADNEILSFWEPNAPSYEERVQSLKFAWHKMFQTSVSIEPMLDPEHIEELVTTVSPLVTDAIWIGKMNDVRKRVAITDENVEREIRKIEAGQTDDRIRAIYEKLNDNPKIKWKESIKKVVGLPLSEKPGMDI